MARARSEAQRIAEEMRRRNGHDRRVPVTFNGNELRDKEFPPVRWAVEGILPAGVTLFGGREKMGKSFLAFGLCIAVATGGHALGKIPVAQGEALYISMEDPERRLQKRLRRLAREDTDLAALHYATEWEPADRGGVDDLDAWLTAHPDCRIVVADTLKRIRPRTTGRRNMYDEDYEAVQPFVKLSAEHNAALMLVHHLNQQAEPSDPFDAFTGSTGLTAAAEGIVLLTRKRGDADAFLMADGKDIEERQDLALNWDAATCVWTIQGDAATYRMHKERREIVELLEREDEPTGPKYVADALGRDHAAVRQMMKRMADDGQLQTAGYGKYVVSQGVSHSSHSSHTSTQGSGVTGVTGVTAPHTRGDGPPRQGTVGDHVDHVDRLARFVEVLENPAYYGGPARTVADYRDDPSDMNLDRLTRSVLWALKMKTDGYEKYRPLVEEAARRVRTGRAGA